VRPNPKNLEDLRRAPGRLPVSVVITTYNEEINVAECVESVLWADEILLVDSFSTDRTVEIARSYPITVLQREYFGSAAQKNWALDRVAHDWVLIIDADERVPEALAREILTTLTGQPAVDGFYIRRENVFIDRVIRHSGWSTDKVVRLFRKDRGRYPNRRVHADLEIQGPVPVLNNPFLHYTFRTFEQYFPKFLNYAEMGGRPGLPRRPPRRGGRVGLAPLVAVPAHLLLPGRVPRRHPRLRGLRAAVLRRLPEVRAPLGVPDPRGARRAALAARLRRQRSYLAPPRRRRLSRARPQPPGAGTVDGPAKRSA
jgi:hypothetical protein